MKRRLANSFILIGTGLLILSMLLSTISFAAGPAAPGSNGGPGRIWTTDGSCGDLQQDVNHFGIGDTVYINGAGFAPGPYDWWIKGQPGGASCDPNIVVASGTVIVPASGVFCFPAYTVQPGDCGEYKVKVGNKGDNYRVEGCQSDTDCDDGLFCNGSETCDTTTGNCVPGTPPNCDDGVACTTDTCDEDSDQCVNTPDDTYCDDGAYCNGVETCDPINDCQAGTPVNCDDGIGCTVDVCDEASDQCVNTPDHALCDDAEVCTDDYCDPQLECLNVWDYDKPGCEVGCTDDTDCDDGLFCNGSEICNTSTGECEGGTPPDCDDANICTDDSCDEVNNQCVNEFDVTNDPSCEPCFGVVCDDGLWCNGLETCDPATGLCVDGTAPDCDDANICTDDSCDEVNDQCVNEFDVTNDPSCELCFGVVCDDGLFCNGSETCDPTTGNCLPGTPPNCNDGIACTVDACDEANDRCVNTPNHALCNDGEVCTDDYCNVLVGCVHTWDYTKPGCEVGCTNDTDCDDGLFCNGSETCDTTTGLCVAGTPPNCDDGDICTDDGCNEVDDSCVHQFDPSNDPSCEAAPVLSADGVARCDYWWAEFYSDVTANYYVKVSLDGGKYVEYTGAFKGKKSLREDWDLDGTHTMTISYYAWVGDREVGDREKRERDCGAPPPGPTATPTPGAPVPPAPTPTVIEVLGVERLPETGGMVPLPAFPLLPLILSSLLLITSGFRLRRKE